MTLSQGEKGKKYIIKEILLSEKTKRRMQILGMTNGTDIEILNKKYSGTVIVKVRGTRFAIGKSFADGVVIGGER